jgi:hypothetical protein
MKWRDRRHLRKLQRKGIVRIGTMRLPDGFLDAPRPKVSGLTEAIVEERREGR